MKKTLIKIFTALAFLTLAGSNSFAGESNFDKEVDIRDAINPVDPKQERSTRPTCQVFLSGNQVEVCLNKYIGEASIVIVNQMGVVVNSMNCDSEFTFATYLNKPTSKGVYRIYILGSNGYQGEGEFSIN